MFDTIVNRLSQYWETFANAPLEAQILVGAALITMGYAVSGASQKLWKVATPVRWLGAKTLNGVSWVLYRGKKKANKASDYHDIEFGPDNPEIAYFNTDSEENFNRTINYYKKGDNVQQLTESQLQLLKDLAMHFKHYKYDDWGGRILSKGYRFLNEESWRRSEVSRLEQINKDYQDLQKEEDQVVDKTPLEEALERIEKLEKEASGSTRPFEPPFVSGVWSESKVEEKPLFKKGDEVINTEDGKGYKVDHVSVAEPGGFVYDLVDSNGSNYPSVYERFLKMNFRETPKPKFEVGEIVALGCDSSLTYKIDKVYLSGPNSTPHYDVTCQKHLTKYESQSESSFKKIEVNAPGLDRPKPKFEVGETIGLADGGSFQYKVLKINKGRDGWLYDVDLLGGEQTVFYQQPEHLFKKTEKTYEGEFKVGDIVSYCSNTYNVLKVWKTPSGRDVIDIECREDDVIFKEQSSEIFKKVS